jgi:2',3'-cyclic-nucleotide 2'-phosphodiesterase (5'-nucleotidase family)
VGKSVQARLIGPFTKQDLMDAMPFTNYVVKIELTGEQLYQALENSVSEVESNLESSVVTTSANAEISAKFFNFSIASLI